MNDLQVLISEYNEIEATQGARLKAIFELLRAEPGYHRLAFSDQTVWSGSLLHHEDQNVINTALGDMVRLITDWQ